MTSCRLLLYAQLHSSLGITRTPCQGILCELHTSVHVTQGLHWFVTFAADNQVMRGPNIFMEELSRSPKACKITGILVMLIKRRKHKFLLLVVMWSNISIHFVRRSSDSQWEWGAWLYNTASYILEYLLLDFSVVIVVLCTHCVYYYSFLMTNVIT